jgi:spore coat polysaccharide biosynthesis protein SpsF
MGKRKQKVTAILQARMGSSRLPGKVLLPLARKPVIWWMVNRCLKAKYIDDVIIATTNHPDNNPIEECIDKYFENSPIVNVFRYSGDEDNVLDRVLAAAKENESDIITDITCDCPLVDPIHIDILVSHLLANDIDYTSNCITRSWPDGLDIQVYYTSVLEECKKIFQPDHHVGINIGHNPEFFSVHNWLAKEDMYYPDWGLTLDTSEDYELLQKIFNHFGSDVFFRVEDVVKYLKDNPYLLKINSHIKRKDISEG